MTQDERFGRSYEPKPVENPVPTDWKYDNVLQSTGRRVKDSVVMETEIERVLAENERVMRNGNAT